MLLFCLLLLYNFIGTYTHTSFAQPTISTAKSRLNDERHILIGLNGDTGHTFAIKLSIIDNNLTKCNPQTLCSWRAFKTKMHCNIDIPIFIHYS